MNIWRCAFNSFLAKRYWRHINEEQAQGGEVVAYLLKYTYRPPSTIDVQMQAMGGKESYRSPHRARNKIREYIRVFICAIVISAVEAFCSLHWFRQVHLMPAVEGHSVLLEGERIFSFCICIYFLSKHWRF